MKAGNDKGAALLTVLLLVAVMSALIAVSFDRVSLAIHRERNRSSSDEVRLNLISAEAIAISRIDQLTASNSRSGEWQGRSITVPVPSGTIRARLRDGGNCFNLNALVSPLPDGRYVAQPVAIVQFARLLQLSGMAAGNAASLAHASTDWIDSDGIALPGGAEDSYYTRLANGYRTANRIMVDKSEWRAVAGVTADLYNQIAPLLCALPDQKLPGYNINTLSPGQSPLIAAILPASVSAEQVRIALANRPAGGFDSAQAFLSQPSLRGALPPGEASIQLQTRSSWFQLELLGSLSDFSLSETALIDGRLRPARLVRRSYGE